MKTAFLAVLITAAGFLSSGSLSNVQAQTPTNTFTDIPVTLTDEAGNVIHGTLDITRFHKQGQEIVAQGRLTAMGHTRMIKAPVTITQLPPAAPGLESPDGSKQEVACTILDLHIGAIDLNLLGLRVQLAPVDLLISAEPAGGLLGQLLCAIANLLNIGNILGVVDILNQILALLG
jgi:hypothetical protein